MQTRRLGGSSLEISRLGFGAWATGGGDWKFGWGPQDDAESVAAIHRALDHGVNWIDTAATYGFGHSEEVVARALEGLASKPLVFTKCGLVEGENREPQRVLKRASVRQECEASLRRLRVETIDLYQIHWPNDDIEEAWTEMLALQKEGKIRYLGVSNFDAAQIARVAALGEVTSLQPPYSLIAREGETTTLPYCKEHGIGVINYSPMYSGLLSGRMTAERVQAMPSNDWRARSAQFQEPKLSRNLQLAALLAEIGEAHGASAGEVAIAWTLRNPAVTGAIVGARNAEQVDGWIRAADLELTDADLARIMKHAQR